MYSVFEEVLHEADLKYIGILLNYGLSVEKIAKDFELDEAYVKKTQSRKSFSCYFCLFFFIPGNPAGRHYLFILSLRIHIYTIFQKKYASYELFICFSAYYMYTKKMEVRINEKPRLLFKIRCR